MVAGKRLYAEIGFTHTSSNWQEDLDVGIWTLNSISRSISSFQMEISVEQVLFSGRRQANIDHRGYGL